MHIRLLRVLACSVAIALVAGCATAGPPSAAPPSAPPAPQVTVVTLSGSGSAMKLVEAVTREFERAHPEIDAQFLRGTNSGGAISAVVDGTLDIAVVNRALTPEEASQAVTYVSFARDSIVFAANIDDVRLSVTPDQLRAIYAGDVLDWAAVDGSPRDLIVLDRDADETMRKTMLMDLMAGTPVDPGATILTSTGDMIEGVGDTDGAIGYATLSAFRIADKPGLIFLEINGVAPNPTTLDSGAYPWSLTFGMVTSPDLSPAARTLHAWLLGPGQALIAGYGAAPSAP